MSAIAGYLGREHKERIDKMVAPLRHRGPDGESRFGDSDITLAHLRLAILDGDAGQQPLSNEDGTLHLVCDGEIYNGAEWRERLGAKGHTFKTRIGAESVLHLYEEHGEECIAKLRGAFALALWDSQKSKLILARDPTGQKPLFHAASPHGFAFASEVKGVFEADMFPREQDLEALWHYMSLRYLPDEKTLFENIRKLPAAHYLVYEKGQTRLERYWTLSFLEKITGSEEELIDRLEETLTEAVRLQLQSDVPVGSFLSGGIDSGLITALMAKVGPTPFPTFSIGVREQGYNELPYARMVSERYGLEAREEVVEADIIRKLPAMIHHLDEPADPFGVGVYLVSQLASNNVKVVLSGDGGDENFAGYDRFAGQKLAQYYSLLPAALRRHVLARLYRMVPDSFGYKSLASKLRWLNEMSFYPSAERYARSLSFLRFTEEGKLALFTADARARLAGPDSIAKIVEHFNTDRASELVDRLLATDLATRMPDHLLAISDRMCMAHSIESRPPLMDSRVTEFAASLPGNMKLRGRKLKYILRRLALRHLPRELVERPKQGFGFPLAQWLRTDLRHFLERLFSESIYVNQGIFEQGEINRLLSEHVSGKVDHNFRIWILLNLELWHRHYFEGLSTADLDSYIAELMVRP